MSLSFLSSLQGALQLMHVVDQMLQGAPGFMLVELLGQSLVPGGQPGKLVILADWCSFPSMALLERPGHQNGADVLI